MKKIVANYFLTRNAPKLMMKESLLESLVSRNDTQEMKEKYLSYMTGIKTINTLLY